MITKLKQYKDSLNIKTNENFDSLPFNSLKNIYNEMFYHFGDDILNYDFSESEKYILEEIFINTENDNDDKLNREQLIHAIALIYDLNINWSDEYGIMSEQELEFQTIGEKCVNIMNEKYPSGWPTIQQIIKENTVNENIMWSKLHEKIHAMLENYTEELYYRTEGIGTGNYEKLTEDLVELFYSQE